MDIVYAPFIERFEIAFGGIRNYDIRAGRPRLAKWIEVIQHSLYSSIEYFLITVSETLILTLFANVIFLCEKLLAVT